MAFEKNCVIFQIIPNSQVYVIPHPTDDPSQWEAKLFITPSRGITLTGFALVQLLLKM